MIYVSSIDKSHFISSQINATVHMADSDREASAFQSVHALKRSSHGYATWYVYIHDL